jgi:hypothetical protein
MLPAALAAVLALAVVVQLMLGADTPLPPAAPGPVRIARSAAPAVPAVIAPPVILERDIFTRPAQGPAGVAAPTAQLGGAAIAGTVSVLGRRVAIVALPGGGFRRIAPGDMIAGWTLLGLGPDGARLRRGAETLILPYGAAVAPPAEPPADPTEDSEQQ